MVTYTPLNETISYRFIIDSKVKDNPYKYDYEVALKYSVLIDKLLNNSNSIYELLNDLMFSNSNTKAKCIESIRNALSIESKLLDSLDDNELNSFINFLRVCYRGEFDIIDCYCNYVNSGVISDVNFRNVSVRRILCRLFEFREELVFDNYIFLKLNQLFYLNTISELLNIRHLDVKDSAFRDKIAYLLLYSNGLEDYLVKYNNMFQFNYDYNQIKNDSDYNLGIKLLLADARQVKEYDMESLMMKYFVDCFYCSLLKFIDPSIINDVNNKGDVSNIKLSKNKDKE